MTVFKKRERERERKKKRKEERFSGMQRRKAFDLVCIDAPC